MSAETNRAIPTTLNLKFCRDFKSFLISVKSSLMSLRNLSNRLSKYLSVSLSIFYPIVATNPSISITFPIMTSMLSL